MGVHIQKLDLFTCKLWTILICNGWSQSLKATLTGMHIENKLFYSRLRHARSHMCHVCSGWTQPWEDVHIQYLICFRNSPTIIIFIVSAVGEHNLEGFLGSDHSPILLRLHPAEPTSPTMLTSTSTSISTSSPAPTWLFSFLSIITPSEWACWPSAS